MLELTATTGFGLEAVVSRELQQLGYTDQKKSDGRVTIQAPPEAIARCNLHLRAADRVLLKMAEFPAEDFDEYFDQIREIPWENWLPADASFPVTGSCHKSILHAVPTLQGMAKKAIANRLEHQHQQSLPETGATFPIQFEVRNNVCTLWLNTTGPGLSRRGYRMLAGDAPLRETLAAALVLLSVWNRERTFLDPLCGSGTIAIEAAMIARNVPPGMHREFAAEHWPTYDDEYFAEARQSARDNYDLSEAAPILAYDQDFRVLKAARENAVCAEVEEIIHFQEQELSQLQTSRKYGCLVTNPPYGQRLNDQEAAREIWRTLADVTADWTTWSIFPFVGARDFEYVFGRKATRRRKLYNGPLECTFYQYLGDKPPRMTRRDNP